MAHRQDRITLADVRIYPRIGTTEEERRAPQECRADLTVWGDFEAAASTDSLAASVDYSRILSLVQETAAEREYNLVETLAYRIARTVLQGFPVSRVEVKLRKRPAVMLGMLDFVEVAVTAP